MTTAVTPKLGKMVLYTMNEADAREVKQKRMAAGSAIRAGNEVSEGDTYPAIIVRDWAANDLERYIDLTRTRLADKTSEWASEQLGKVGINTPAQAPKTFEALVVKLATAAYEQQLEQASQNLQVFLDGNDVYWATSRSRFDPEKHGRWVHLSHGNDLELPSGMPTEEDKLSDDIQFRPDAKGHWRYLETVPVATTADAE